MLVPQRCIFGGLQTKKLLGKDAFKVMTYIGHVATELGFDEP